MNDQTLPAEQAPKSITNANLQHGGALAALVPASLEDAFRLSKALAASGDMVPKPFQDKPEATMAAILRGMEIGLAPMQALSSIAVINGRASLWGDALPALMFRAGHTVDVSLEGDDDARKAIATLTRGDTGAAFTRTFSVQDAKRANLWGKAGPWQSYPERMLSMRARTMAIRDGAPDALMGLQVAEEVQDYAPMRDVTPPPSKIFEIAAKARQKAAEPHWTATIDTAGAFPGSDAFDAGVAAFQSGEARESCPPGDDAVDWLGGWDAAKGAAE